MKKQLIICALLLAAVCANAQSTLKTLSYGLDATIASGIIAPSLSVYKNFSLKKSKDSRFGIGLGARFTHVNGNINLEYLTAPAILTSGKKGPGVLVADQIITNIDTFKYGKTAINALNIMLAFNYRISRKIAIEFNIDAVGFSFGAQQTGILQNPNFLGTIGSTAKPTAINALLISDNDKGTLNSQIALKYKFTNTLTAKLGAGFLFTEYTNDISSVVNNTLVPNDRFRNKALGGVIGVIYNFEKTSPKKIINKNI